MDIILDLLFPRACLLCHRYTREAHHLCPDCLNELPILSHYCKKCDQFLHSSQSGSLTCGDCLQDPPPYHHIHALFPYIYPLPRLVAGLKFDAELYTSQLFSQRLLHSIKHTWLPHNPLPDLILAMPLHAERLKERGFNQAMEIAKPVAKALSIPLDIGTKRQKATLPQSSLSAKERLKNMVNAFATQQSYQGLHIAIVDDVVTTGQTVITLSQLLIKNGAKRVDIWCIARR